MLTNFNLTPALLFKILLISGAMLGNFLLVLFHWVTLRNVQLLNRTLKTNLAPALVLIALLFLLTSIGTLILAVTLWIKLFI